MLRDLRIGLIALLLGSVACGRGTGDALLIRIDGVEQAFERPGELLLRGAGFPQGMRGEARLRGALYPAGKAPLALDLLAPCRALGSQKARVELEASGSSLQAEGPFEGQIELRFGTHQDAQLVGRIERALFRLGTAPLIEEHFALSQRAERFQRALGIDLMEQTELGLSVAELSRDSLAHTAGLAARDVVLRMDGRPVQLGRDLVAHDQSREVLLEVRRAGEGATRMVRIVSSSSAPTPDLVLIVLALLLGVGAGVVFVSALPSHVLWAPRRREYWLLLCCAVCTVCLGALVVRDVDPLLSRMCEALVLGAITAGFGVYLRRRIHPTLRTSKDPNLAPLL